MKENVDRITGYHGRGVRVITDIITGYHGRGVRVITDKITGYHGHFLVFLLEISADCRP